MVILDLSRLLPGAVATQILCDLGATVFKIEQPGGGDPARNFPERSNHLLFDKVNAGKKSVVIDLKQSDGKNALIRMVERADVLIESFRPGVMQKLGLSYKILSRCNPRLLYVTIGGYGPAGHYAKMPGHDLNYCALAGLLRPNERCEPRLPLVQSADILGGLYATIGTLFGYISRDRSSTGQKVDVSLFETALWLMPIVRATCNDGLLSGSYGCYNIYNTKDEGWITVSALEHKYWKMLCERIGCENLIEYQFVSKKQQQIIKALRRAFLTRTSRYWFRLLADACVTPVLDGTTVKWDRQVVEHNLLQRCDDAIGYRVNYAIPRLSQTRRARSHVVPVLGQHTREALAWAGFSASEIDFLASRSVIVTGKNPSRQSPEELTARKVL